MHKNKGRHTIKDEHERRLIYDMGPETNIENDETTNTEQLTLYSTTMCLYDSIDVVSSVFGLYLLFPYDASRAIRRSQFVVSGYSYYENPARGGGQESNHMYSLRLHEFS